MEEPLTSEDAASESDIKKQFTTVTPVSKYLAMLLFIAMPFIGGWIGYNYAPEKVIEVEKIVLPDNNPDLLTKAPIEERINDTSVVTGESQQVGTFTGFYTTFEKEAWGETATCHSLTVTEGHETLTSYFVDMVERGNTVQMIDDLGRLVLNLPWGEIPAGDKERILNSTEDNQTSLTLKKNVQQPTGAAACHSFFSYVDSDLHEKEIQVSESETQQVAYYPADDDFYSNKPGLLRRDSWPGFVSQVYSENDKIYLLVDKADIFTSGGSCRSMNGICVVNHEKDNTLLELAADAYLTLHWGCSDYEFSSDYLGYDEKRIKEDGIGVQTGCSILFNSADILQLGDATIHNTYWFDFNEAGQVKDVVQQYFP